MSLFKTTRGEKPSSAESDGALPVTLFDSSKRYDLYCSTPSEDRVYEDVRVTGIRTFEPKKHDHGISLIGGYLEIETRNGARMMIPHHRIYMISEQGSQPAYKVLSVRTKDSCV